MITANPYSCAQCLETFGSKANLLRHGQESQHQPYSCECGARFSRLDVLNRHLKAFSLEDPRYPCKYCRRHRGADGFRRKDHLMQHIRNYHHHEVDDTAAASSSTPKSRLRYVFPICPHPGCPQHRDDAFKQLPRNTQLENKPFSSIGAYTSHMREEHDECSFPCDISGCNRVGRRGYFREKDLMRHRKEQHPDARGYQTSQRDLRHQCTVPNCARSLGQSSIRDHYRFVHGERWQTDGRYIFSDGSMQVA